jgi:uncharacterized membrane protein YfcA
MNLGYRVVKSGRKLPMNGTSVLWFIVLGIVAGIFSGLIGVGGGVVIVPALVFLFGFSEHKAQGTTLALLVPPVGLLAAWAYYRHGYVDLKAAAMIAAGFLLGGLGGAQIATRVSNATLEKIFGAALVLIGLKMMLARSA